jgi:starvation-inducible outer membrane lipoprotein
MKHAIAISALLASMTLALGGCSMMPNGHPAQNDRSATTREQCRQQGATTGSSGMGRNAMTAKIDVDCATMMPN